jgi:hypothetical protein
VSPVSAPAPEHDELPRRRRRSPVTADTAPAAREPEPAEHARTPEQTGATWASFQAGTESGRAAVETEQPREGDRA